MSRRSPRRALEARVWAAGEWRVCIRSGFATALDALNGIGHAAGGTDPEFRAVLAAHGYRLDLETGEVVELAGYAGAFSARAAQIGGWRSPRRWYSGAKRVGVNAA